jgi:hemolysin activation/secretion protein
MSTLICTVPARSQVPAVQPPPPGSPIPRVLPQTGPNVRPGMLSPPPATAEPGTTTGSVSLSSVGFEGMTAYPEAALRDLTAGLVGPSVPRAEIERARLAILERYRRDGAVFTAVATRLAGGRLTFVVTEGHIANIEIDGDVGPVRAQILRFLDHLRQEQPLKVASLERWMLLVTDIPGLTAHAVMQPSSGEPGALTLVVQVSRKVVEGVVLIDNRAYQFTGPYEGLLSVNANSLTSLGERTTFSFFHSLNDSQIFGQASTEMFLGSSGLRFKVYGGAGNTIPTGPLQSFGYFGYTTIFGGQLSYPLIRQRQQTLSLVANLDAVQSSVSEDQGVNGAPERISYDSERVLRVGADYAWLDVLAGDTRSATNSIAVKVSQGLPLLGASANGAADAGRPGERIDFTKVNGEIARTQTLFSPWPQASVSLRADAAGQYSLNVLPPVETFYLGGATFNRGYYAGEITGDSGISFTLEPALNTPVPMPGSWPFQATAQFYVFYDWGQTWESRSTDAAHTLRSTGLGVRFFPTGTTDYEFDLEGVKRLQLYPNGTGPGVSALRSEAFYFQALVRF